MTKLRALDLERMLREEPPPVPWVVEDLVVRGMLTVLYGEPGEGKSLLAGALAAGVATGQDEAGLVCCRGSAVIVDAENGEGEIWRRARTIELPAKGIELYEADGFDLRKDLDELDGILARHEPSLLVLDSFRSMWAGDENDSRETATALDPLGRLVERHNVGALLLHHSGKSGDYRGNSAIRGSAELMFQLARQEGDQDRSRRYLHTRKCRPAPEPDRRWLRLDIERGRVFIDAALPPEGTPTPTAPVRTELRPRVLAALDGKRMSQADIARAVDRHPKDRSVRRVLDDLERDHEIAKDSGRWRRVAGGAPPIDSRHPATPAANPHGNGQNGGGNQAADEEALATLAEAEIERVSLKQLEWGDELG